jgi:GT2 family glycosyltransferase
MERTRILVLNYNGRALLDECLPSIIAAARRAPTPCAVTVVDNDSTDDSRAWLARNWPEIDVVHRPNRGLASFNDVLAGLDERVVLLLNNDVKLASNAVGPLLEVFVRQSDAFFSAPLCWTFDGTVYEGMRTRVRSRFGLVQGMCRVPGHERSMRQVDLTAAAGPVLAVDRARFLELGGYDPLYFPGRIEDLDLGFRAWMAGWRGYYAPDATAWHKGFATFRTELGEERCDGLATRNTLLFAWKHLRGMRRASHAFWLAVRLGHALVRRRWAFVRAFGEALAMRREAAFAARPAVLELDRSRWIERQEAFFRRFEW